MSAEFQIRLATMEDVPTLNALMELSIRILQARDYSPAQIDLALKHVYGVDTQLIADRTYFAVEAIPRGGMVPVIAACGGWSRRKTLYGGDVFAGREDDLLDPARDAAKIRAFFVHPDWARRGIATMILEASEAAAQQAGFRSCEMGATLTGVPFYRSRGYAELEHLDVPFPGGESFPIIRMKKTL